jgi:hypothetical protein
MWYRYLRYFLKRFYCTLATKSVKDPLKQNGTISNLTHLFIALLCELGQVEVQDGETPRGDITASQTVHHEHGPDRTLPLPVTCTEERKPLSNINWIEPDKLSHVLLGTGTVF